MSRFSLAALLATLATLVAFVALAGGAGASNPTRGADIYGVGGGKGDFFFGIGVFSFDLSAHQNASGVDFGHAGGTITNLVGDQVSYRIDVDCIHLFSPTRASISGVVTKVSPSPNFLNFDLGDRLLLTVEDGGNPSAAAPVDTYTGPVEFGGACNLAAIGGGARNVTQGNVVVNDG